MEKGQLAAYIKAVKYSENVDEYFLELGRILSEAQEAGGDLYKNLMDLLDRRTAYYLIEIDKAFNPLGVERSELIAVGWTKLARIARHVTQDNVEEMLVLARDSTDRQLRAIVQGETPPKKARVVLLYLRPKHYRRYAQALLMHGATSVGKGLAGQENALMKIITKVLKG